MTQIEKAKELINTFAANDTFLPLVARVVVTTKVYRNGCFRKRLFLY